MARAEQKEELAEFDDSIPWHEREVLEREQQSKLEMEPALLGTELMPVERYAVTFLELQQAPVTQEELQGRRWALPRRVGTCHLKVIKKEDDRRAEIEEDDMLCLESSPSKASAARTKHGRSTSKLYSCGGWEFASFDDDAVAIFLGVDR